jgi:hypothetical protein
MSRSRSPTLALLLLLVSPLAAAWDVDQLMRDLASQKSGRARFVEKKFLAILDQPVVSSGELFYEAPGRLEKRTLQPRPELLRLEGDHLSIEQGKRRFSLRLAEQPEALAFVDSIRGTLAGDLQALRRSYAVDLSGTPESWALRLLPSDPRIGALVLRIDIAGRGKRVLSIRYLQADGDSAVMSIEPIEAK